MAEKNLGRVVGLSAYEVAKSNGFEGTESDWLASLKGDKGDSGMPSEDGSAGQVLMTDGQGGHYWGDTAPGNAIADVALNESLSDETKNVLDITDYDDGVKRLELPRGTPALRVEVSVRDDPYTADKTAAELYAAYESGRTIICHLLTTSGDYDLPANSSHKGGNACGVSFHGVRSGWELSVSVGTEGVWFSKKTLAYADALPTALPNPQPLTINGQSYDGSEAVEVELSDGKDGQDGAPGADGYTPVRGKDYWTDEDKAEINADSHAFITQALAERSQLKPEFAKNVTELEQNGDTGKLYVLPDGYIYAYMDEQWANTGIVFTSFDTLEKVISATCDMELVGKQNYNLFKASGVTYGYRLQNDSAELVTSTSGNVVSGWIPVAYGKYYAMSALVEGERVSGANANSFMVRANVRDDNGDVTARNASMAVSPASSSTIYIDSPETVAMQVQINLAGADISAADKLGAYEVMLVEGDTAKEARDRALTYAYMDGDVGTTEVASYKIKSDDTKADKAELEALREKVQNRPTAICRGYDDNYIPNDRFIRSIANFRDTSKAKDFEIVIGNNSGSTIKNAAIAVGLHNTVGVNPEDNNMPFQIYDDDFGEGAGFKFYDGSTELPYYIESESNCNYIVDKKVKTGQKAIAVFSNGKIAVYNADVKRMQLTADDGITWTDICSNITSLPYRVLLPDSQDNLFVASGDGRILYKYTSADGYTTGTAVIDMATIQESVATDVEILVGSILAEDSEGNLYLGTYQTKWCCVILKSTDHGDTWSVVYNTTESQHVHNIFVNKKVSPNEIFIAFDGEGGVSVKTYVSKDAGATWTEVCVPYYNNDYAFRYAGENFYIGCGERNVLGGATLYKTTDYSDADAYYTLFDNGQGIRDIINVFDGSDDVLIAGGCVGDPVMTEQLFLSEDRGETWKTVLMQPYHTKQIIAGIGLRTFSRKDNQVISQTSSNYAMRFVYGSGAKTILAVVSVGDIPPEGKAIALKTGYVANIERMDKVLTLSENISGKVADIRVCSDCVIDAVSNKRVLTSNTELCSHNVKVGQTSEYKILSDHAYRLNGSVNFGKLSRLDFAKGFTISLVFRKEDGKSLEEYLADSKDYAIFRSGGTELALRGKAIVLISGDTTLLRIPTEAEYFRSANDDYVRVTAYFTADDLPVANVYTENKWRASDSICTEYPITDNLCDNDFVFGCDGMPNIARLEIYNRVLSHGEIMALTNGCNLVTDGSKFN